MLRRFISDLVAVVALTIITSMILGAVVVSGLYALYLALLANGLEPAAAMLTIGSLALLTALVFGLVTLLYLRRLFEKNNFFHKIERTFSFGFIPVIDAFIDGLLTRKRIPPHRRHTHLREVK